MERKELFQKIMEETDVNLEQIEKVYLSMAHVISDTLGKGEEVTLNPELGLFAPKLWDNPGMNENSPRTRKDVRYKVRFRPGREMERCLKVTQGGSKESDEAVH